MRRLSLVLGCLLVLAFAMPVSAAPPDRFKVPTITFGDYGCGFFVEATATFNNEYETDFYDKDGNLVRALITGAFFTTIENPANGKTISENESGSGHFDLVKGTFIIVGRNGVFSYIYDGRLDVYQWIFTGHISNEICEALA